MNIQDVDPKYGLPLWWQIVHHFSSYPPLLQAPQLPAPRQAGTQSRISRVWHGWAAPAEADAFEGFLRERALPDIQAKALAGFRGIQLSRRPDGEEVEFITEMWFDDLEAVKRYAGEDYTRSTLPPEEAALLNRYDSRVRHYEVRVAR